MLNQKRYLVKTMMLFCLLQGLLHALPEDELEQTKVRIKPIGQVRTEGGAVTKQKEAPKVGPTGQEIYDKYCIVCHQTGVAGAPKFRDEASWKPRLAGKNINALVAIAIKGLNAMPQKGTCQECSDSDIKAAINYMVPQK